MNRHATNRRTEQLRIKLDPIPADPRVAFVDRALTLMTDGRYGESRMSCLLVNSFGRCDIDGAVLDVSELGLAKPIDFDAIDKALDLCDPLRSLRTLRETRIVLRKAREGRKGSQNEKPVTGPVASQNRECLARGPTLGRNAGCQPARLPPCDDLRCAGFNGRTASLRVYKY